MSACCPALISSSVDASHVLVSSSRVAKPCSPLGGRYSRQSQCGARSALGDHIHTRPSLLAPFFHRGCKSATLDLSRLRVVHSLRGSSAGILSGSSMNLWSREWFATPLHSSYQRCLIQVCLDVSGRVSRRIWRACR